MRRLSPDIDFRGRDVRSVFFGDSKDFLVNYLVEVGGRESGAKFGDLLRVFQEEGASRELDIEFTAIDRNPKAMLVGNPTEAMVVDEMEEGVSINNGVIAIPP